MMLIIIIVLLVILLGTMAFGGYYLVSSFNSTGEEQTEEIEEEEESDKSTNTLIEIGDSVYTNLLVGEDKKGHIAKINLNLDVKGGEDGSEELVATMNSRIVVVRDIINSILRKKTYEELNKVDGVENFKDEVLDKVRKEFNSNLILNVYIKEIALQ